jgi:hypothetical protein
MVPLGEQVRSMIFSVEVNKVKKLKGQTFIFLNHQHLKGIFSIGLNVYVIFPESPQITKAYNIFLINTICYSHVYCTSIP